MLLLMKILNGSELAGFIKERQAKTVRSLRQAHSIIPKLVIIRTNPDPVVDSYMRLKANYGADILIDVDVVTIQQDQAMHEIAKLNTDQSVHGIIVQIPLPNPTQTTQILNIVGLDKDVDGLSEGSKFDAPTPMAINWLLSGYGVDLQGKNLVIVGHGWQASGLNVTIADKKTADLKNLIKGADVLVTATGVPGLVTDDMVNPKAVIIDAGVATDSNGLVGDVAPSVRDLPDITITPEKGGVGPLTVCALFENVIRSAQSVAKTTGQH